MTTTSFRDTIEETLSRFMEIKTRMAMDNRGPVELDPHLIAVPTWAADAESAQGYVAKLPGHPVETMPAAWLMLLDKCSPAAVYLVTEAYAKPSGPSLLRRGQLAEEFKSDPTTDIVELLSVTAVDIVSGAMATAHVMFTTGDGGLPVYGTRGYADDRADPEAAQGDIPWMMSFLRDATAYRQRT